MMSSHPVHHRLSRVRGTEVGLDLLQPAPARPRRPADDRPAPRVVLPTQRRPIDEPTPDGTLRFPPSWWFRFALSQLARLYLCFLIGATLLVTLVGLLPGWSTFVVRSGSMAPKIEVGDVVIVQARDDYSKGQVVTFHNPDLAGAVTTHRISADVDGRITTKGDANSVADPLEITRADIIGTGRILVPWIGLPMVWAQQRHWVPLGVFWASVLLALVVWRSDPELSKGGRHVAPR
ncbi:signal peptidase I [Nakamurella sp. YIM 132087]|uniref:Signal peptidase I n=1 Tax=Nakamurella alba TaxID=2665158 RepID=A0A7K1FM37_9ACTN|nr:signal peptidase I [Nakamurella alba]MTD15222.1 signal peptidase I [Nakamurella alba]